MLNRDLVRISEWASLWKVTFNAWKSKDIIFSNKLLNNSPPLTFNNNYIERVNTHKHLGVYFTSPLDWNVQVSEMCLRANRISSVFRNVKLLNSASADGGPRSTSAHAWRSARPPIDTSGNFSAHMSGGGWGENFQNICLINFLAKSGNSKHFSFFSFFSKKN